MDGAELEAQTAAALQIQKKVRGNAVRPTRGDPP